MIHLSWVQSFTVILSLTLNLSLSATRPHSLFTEIEQIIIENGIEKFLQKGIIRLSSFEDGQVISPIFKRPKRMGLTGLYLKEIK